MTSPANVDVILSFLVTGIKYSAPCLLYYCWSNGQWYLITLLILFYALYVIAQHYKLPKKSIDWSSINDQDVALVTGGSSGLGCEIVKDLLKTPIKKVIILDIAEATLKNERVDFHMCNIGEEDALFSTIGSIIGELNASGNHISIIVNNAGVRHNEPLLDLRPEKIRYIFNVNTFANIWISKLVLKNHVNNILPKNKNGKLFVVSVSSILGVLAPRNLSVYSASKASTIQIHEALTQEMSEYPSIRLLLVLPGQLTTKMFSDVTPPREGLAPLVDHRDLAHHIVSKIQYGEKGVLCTPLYANFLPTIKSLPILFQDLCRKFSKMDETVKVT